MTLVHNTYLSQDGCLLSCCDPNGLLGNGGGTRCCLACETGCALFPGTPWLAHQKCALERSIMKWVTV